MLLCEAIGRLAFREALCGRSVLQLYVENCCRDQGADRAQCHD
jgi:hypothetical protein